MPAKPDRLTTATRDLTALGGDTLRLLFLMSTTLVLAAAQRYMLALGLVGTFASARVLLFLLKAVAKRKRPDEARHGVVIYTSSFPSGHTFMSVMLFLSAALLVPAGAGPAVGDTAIALSLIVGLAIGWTRMTLGIHWPSDVVVGWLGGVAWALGAALLLH